MNKIIEIKFGSHLYGTNTPSSDLDFKGIYLPTAREIVLGSYKKTISTSRPKQKFERNIKDDVDVEFFSLDRYLELLMQGQTVALDMLFAPKNMYSQDDGVLDLILHNKDRLLTRNINAFCGYAKQQAAKYGIKGSRMDALKRIVSLLDTLPLKDKLIMHQDKLESLVQECKELVSLEKTSLIEIVHIPGPNKSIVPHISVNTRKCPFYSDVKYAKSIYSRILDEYGQRAHKAHLSGGKDWKALSHAVRVNSEALELLQIGSITFPRPDRELLVKIKTEQLSYELVAELIEQGLSDLYEAQEKSSLRDEPDREWANDLIFEFYSNIVANGCYFSPPMPS